MQKKTIRKVLVHTLATGLFLFVLSLNLTVSLTGGWSLGFNKARADESDGSNKYNPLTGYKTCTDFTASQSIVSTGSGQVGVQAQLGILGTYSAGVNPGASGTTTTNMEVAITYPKNSDGTAMQLAYTYCLTGGTESCNPTNPCRDIALSELGIRP